jgi:hypothetical protein
MNSLSDLINELSIRGRIAQTEAGVLERIKEQTDVLRARAAEHRGRAEGYLMSAKLAKQLLAGGNKL